MASATANVLGAYLIETFLALMLFGINLSQSYLYWLNRKRDPLILQFTVLAVAAIETLHSTLMMHATYHYLISESCNPSAFQAKIIWSAGICVVSGVFIPLLVQMFYVRRIWILSQGNFILTYTALTFLILRTGFGLAIGIFPLFNTLPQLHTGVSPRITLAGVSISASTDLLITAILIYLLQKSRTGFKDTDHILERLMAYVVHTGAITAACSLVMIFLFVFLSDSLAYAGLSFIANKLYANSLLGTLNARQGIRNTAKLSSSEIMGRVQKPSNPPTIEIFQETTKTTDDSSEGFHMSRVSHREGSESKVLNLA